MTAGTRRGPGGEVASRTVDLPGIGWCRVEASARGLRRIELGAAEAAGQEGPAGSQAGQWLAHAVVELEAYAQGSGERFAVPLDLEGLTAFQRAVLRACQGVPWGATASYGELARRAGRPGAARAVGQVMARNPLPLVIPCHRVVGADGRLTGFGGGLKLKQRLLDRERAGA